MLPENHQIIKSSLKSREDRDVAIMSGKKELMEKIKNARIGRLSNQQKKQMLPQFLQNPELLVGKTIQHKVNEEDNNEMFWGRGVVLKVYRTYSNSKRTEYEVRYDSEPEEVWKFPLLADMEKGDLLVL